MPLENFRTLRVSPGTQWAQNMIAAVQKIEKRTFPATEAFDFDFELKKNNTILMCTFESSKPESEPIAYMVYVRIKRIALLHKICVVEARRHLGIAKWMLKSLQALLQKQGCDELQLWVDENRGAAMRVYSSCGFGPLQKVENYYGPGRTALKMTLEISPG
ncbi:MAG: hypothetical protein M1829_004337 [Trizodia sp. TS-e1964]|nr:MAG: hypothetical protein M1829_004337 [Trizodia sp. TS-e1964]